MSDTRTTYERVATDFRIRTARGDELAATLTPGDADTGVILAHGFLSDRHAGGRFERLADAYAAAGHAVLRFDFSGFGESDGVIVDGDALLEDLHAAIEDLLAKGLTRLAVHGHSLGSAVALRVAPQHPEVRTLVLTGAITGAGNADAPYPFFTDAQLEAWYRDEDVLLPASVTSSRAWVTVNRTRPKVGATGTQEELLRAVETPVLIVHGDQGDQEARLAAITAEGERWLPPGSRIEVIEGAEHTFFDHQDELVRIVGGWVAEHLPDSHDT